MANPTRPSYDSFTFRKQSQREQDFVASNLQLFSQLTTYRNAGFAAQWEEVAQLIEPSFTNTFMFGSYNTPGQKKTERQIDATGMMANARFAAICDSLLTPRNMTYQRLSAGGDNAAYLMKDRKVRLYFEEATKVLFRERYKPQANFASQNYSNYRSLGAFGNMAMFVDEIDDPYDRGLRYFALPMGEVFFFTDHQNRVVGFIRWFKLTAGQANTMWPGQLPPNLHAACNMQSQQLYNFLHCVLPRSHDDYDPQRLDARGKRWCSTYVSMEGRCLMFKEGNDIEGGYRVFPLAAGRYDQGPNEVYGRGPAMMVLPALKTLNAQKRIFLKAGHRALDPVLLSKDDGLVGFVNRPGAMNPGGVTDDGKPLIHALPVGDIQIGKEMLAEERNLINDAFLVTLFQILVKTPQMSATEVIERANEKGILLAPTMGRQQGEYIGPFTDRELDLLAFMGKLPEQPGLLKEAKGAFHIVYDNPLSRLAKAQESAGFMRTLESLKEIVNITQDVSLLDPFNFDVSTPAMAEQNAVPESWMADARQIAAKRKGRAQAQQAEAQNKALPNQAAMISAKAKMIKADPSQGGQQQPGAPGQQPQPGQGEVQ